MHDSNRTFAWRIGSGSEGQVLLLMGVANFSILDDNYNAGAATRAGRGVREGPCPIS